VRLRKLACAFVVVLQGFVLTSCLGPSYPSAPPFLAGKLADQTVTTGQRATFTVAAAGGEPFNYQWSRDGAIINGATAATYTTAPCSAADDHAQFQVEVTNGLGKVMSDPASLNVHDPYDVLTWHNDNARTGQNLGETFLTPDNVNSDSFGKIGFFPVDGKVDAQPLFVAHVSVSSRGTPNILYVATEHDSVYAFEADTGAIIWQVYLPSTGETSSDPRGVNVLTPEIGITSTPVIDRGRGPNGALYVVAMSKDANGNYFQRLHALDLATGEELLGGPTTIQAKYPGLGQNSDGENVVFDPKQYKERSALLLANGIIYTTWCSHEDLLPYTGWIIGYDASTLTQTHVLDITPNGAAGAFWSSGGGPAVDSAGNIYALAANGTFDSTLDVNGFPAEGDYGNAFLKLSPAGKLTVADYFSMMNELDENGEDMDFGSGGVLVLPDLADGANKVWHLAVGAGKDGNIYVVNRDSMGKFNRLVNNVYQEILGSNSGGSGLLNGEFSSPAYFNNTLYYGAQSDRVKAFTITDAQLPNEPTKQTSEVFGYPGTTPSISANVSSAAILWALENNDPAVLHAYDANDLSMELYNSTQAPNFRDEFGPQSHFITPTIANGKVYVGTPTGIAVFGLLK
jgi:hypothetical protein